MDSSSSSPGAAVAFWLRSDIIALAIALVGWLLCAAYTLFSVACLSSASAPSPASVARPRWTSANGAKAWTERLFVMSSPLWVGVMAVVIVSRWYKSFREVEWAVVGGLIVAPSLLLPLVLRPAAGEAHLPLHRRHWVRAHVWLGIVVFVGSYFWTHYFNLLLGASYTFTREAWCLNGVPLAMYAAAHAYFCLYHSATNMALRRWYSSEAYARLAPRPLARAAGTACLVAAMAWATAFMEAFSIQGFPGYRIENYQYMYTVGSIVYGLYFVVTFPMYFRVGSEEADEGGARAAAAAGALVEAPPESPPPPSKQTGKKASSVAAQDEPGALVQRRRGQSPTASAGRGKGGALPLVAAAVAAELVNEDSSRPERQQARTGDWDLGTTALDSLAASMIVTILLDLWRIATLPSESATEPNLTWTRVPPQ